MKLVLPVRDVARVADLAGVPRKLVQSFLRDPRTVADGAKLVIVRAMAKLKVAPTVPKPRRHK